MSHSHAFFSIGLLLISSIGEKPKVETYPYGSRGPKGIDDFTAKYGYKRTGNED